jgi:anaerobic selenocysteine-containing dehydrogenase
MPSAHIPALFKAIRTGDPYRVRAMLIFGNNSLVSVANSREVYEALRKLDLLVVTDLFMTPTAAMADYVLPAAFWPEVEQVIGYPLVAENVAMVQKALLEEEKIERTIRAVTSDSFTVIDVSCFFLVTS